MDEEFLFQWSHIFCKRYVDGTYLRRKENEPDSLKSKIVTCKRNAIYVHRVKKIATDFSNEIKCITSTVWKVSKYGVFSGPYFPVSSLNTGKHRPEKTLDFDTFNVVQKYFISLFP